MLKFDAETAAFLDRAYAGRDVTRRRYANLDALDPRPGETIVDLGCGNGLMLPELHRAMDGRGRIIGIDTSPDMLAAAAARTRELETVELIESTAEALPLPARSADGIVSVQVFEYIPDLPAALARCAEVLKPGGRLVIGGIHWDSLAWGSDDPARMDRIVTAYDRHLAERRSPELLPGLMRSAGFSDVRIAPHQTTDFTLRRDGLAAMMLRVVAGYVQTVGIAPDDAQAWAAEQETRAEEGRFFFSVTHYVVSARRR